jgi:hypothetical protein
MDCVKKSLVACLEAGYQLLHIDPSVDRRLPTGEAVAVEIVARRTVELMAHAEQVRRGRGLPPIAYEVGTEEVHGGLTGQERINHFLNLLKRGLQEAGLAEAWPCFIVAQVGTDLHTTSFDVPAAGRLYDLFAPLGSLAKGHYTGKHSSKFMNNLQTAVVESGRWQKWLLPGEKGLEFNQLSPTRQDWLLETGSRYVWTALPVVEARQRLYDNLATVMPDPHRYVVDRVVQAMARYIVAFNLVEARKVL